MDTLEGNIHQMRENYDKGSIDIHSVYPSPYSQFEQWFDAALAHKVPEPNAMVLSTATQSGIPSSRVVLLKGFSKQGFVFFTNYTSRKGKELSENPHGSLNFWWASLERQIRIDGVIEKISEQESDTYFYSRPIGSQAGAIVSPQSEEIESRVWLEQKFIEIQLNGNLKRPDYWGGYILMPIAIEFWQGRSNRLHDRLLYEKQVDATWKIKRLAP
jgi:pyridoxamine 5'-phosphate oxidase